MSTGEPGVAMEMHQIRYFLSVAEMLNFTRAAEHCHVSQPSLTRAIKKLEDELGGELFRRERARTHMTELGRTMLPLLKQSLDCAIAAKAEAERYGRGESTPLRLGLSRTVELSIILPALRELIRAMPGLELHLTRKPADEVMQQLEDAEIELCVTAVDEITWERIDRWPLFTEDFVLFAGAQNSLGDKYTAELTDLNDQKLVARPYCEKANALAAILEEEQISATFEHEMSGERDFGAAIGEGLGIGVAPRSVITPEGVVAFPLKDIELHRTVSLFAVSGRRYSPVASALIRLLRAADWSGRQH